MLDQVRTMACPRNQHVAGDREGVLAHVRICIDYNQTVHK